MLSVITEVLPSRFSASILLSGLNPQVARDGKQTSQVGIGDMLSFAIYRQKNSPR